VHHAVVDVDVAQVVRQSNTSVLVARANRRDAQAMPPLASTVVDAAGVDLLTRWVNSLSSCN